MQITILTVYLIVGCILVLYFYNELAEAAMGFSATAKVIYYIWVILIGPAVGIYTYVEAIIKSICKNEKKS